MCLYTNEKEPRVAQEDINVYKVLLILKDGSLKSPYHQSFGNWNFNELYINSQSEDISQIFELMEIGPGFFHSYLTEEACNEMVGKIRRQIDRYKSSQKVKIFRAIIPKGTSFYVGQRSDICSKAIIIKDDFT